MFGIDKQAGKLTCGFGALDEDERREACDRACWLFSFSASARTSSRLRGPSSGLLHLLRHARKRHKDVQAQTVSDLRFPKKRKQNRKGEG